MKPLFIQGPSITTRLVILAFVSAALMAVDHRQNYLEDLRGGISVLVYPLQYLVNLPVSASSWIDENLSSRETLLEENSRLKMQHTLFKAKLLKLNAIKAENLRLRELLQSSKKVGEQVLIGELLAVDLEPFTRQVVINKGSRDGVYLGQPLIEADGVMGQIVHLGPLSSTAMLITDANHATPVQVNRNGLRAIAVGTGAPDRLTIPYLPISTDIVEGDLLVSSGLGGRFPPDYPVAVVSKVEKNPTQPYAVIHVVPTAKLERSREVLLVWPTGRQRQSDDANETPAPTQDATAP
ncbi:MAG TPA: rod shape-determining protein MreC [Gammaproteobacteria bacterium]|nr:rod shape-determining protein MreC [Gammaproteobacteria bacterium]